MRRVQFLMLTMVACLAALATAARAQLVVPRSARAFQNSVGVDTHIVYFDTAYGDWPRIVSALDELGIKHLRDGVYANPAPGWHDWNERYYEAVELAAIHGIKFDFGMGQPGFRAGTVAQLIAVVGTRLRRAVDALEDPNEFDQYGGMQNWPGPLAAYDRELYEMVKRDASLRSLPVIGPSLAGSGSTQMLGDQHRWLDLGNVHPYTGGLSPTPAHTDSELMRAAMTAPGKPVWATEAGFHNALRVPSSSGAQRPVSEWAGAIYTLRTLLEHFKSGVARTYLYELIDEKPDRGDADPEQHFGLLRNDFSPKPAFVAVRNLLQVVGRGAPPAGFRALNLDLTTDAGDLRDLVLQRSDGTYVVALWRLASVWDTTARRPMAVTPSQVRMSLPARSSVAIADPMVGPTSQPLRLFAGTARVPVGADPVLLLVSSHTENTAKFVLHARRRGIEVRRRSHEAALSWLAPIFR